MAAEPADVCAALASQRSALCASSCLEGGGGWLAQWEAAQRKRYADVPDGGESKFSPLHGWVEVGTKPHVVEFDGTTVEWDLASNVDTEAASVPEIAYTGRRDHAGQEVQELDRLFAAIYPLIRQYELEHASPDDCKVVDYLPADDLAAAVNLDLPEEVNILEGSLHQSLYVLRR
jgi:hypothetical protein